MCVCANLAKESPIWSVFAVSEKFFAENFKNTEIEKKYYLPHGFENTGEGLSLPRLLPFQFCVCSFI